MTGSVAQNFHSGSRSEILADYLFSGWGTVTPVRRSDDYGIDLQCTLNETVGRLGVVTDYYSVQVKSGDDPWVFNTADEIRWLYDYPTPLFLACVDKAGMTLAIYHTNARFLAAMWQPPPASFKLTPTGLDEGEHAAWRDATEFSLSAPILRVSLDDFLDSQKLAGLRDVLKYWVELDAFNCDLRRIGLLRFRMPPKYRVNEVPTQGGFVEQGMTRPDDNQFAKAIRILVEAVDCVGDQLRVREDRTATLLSAMLLRHLRQQYPEALSADPRWNLSTARLESWVSHDLRLTENSPPTYMFERIDKMLKSLASNELVCRYLANAAVDSTSVE